MNNTTNKANRIEDIDDILEGAGLPAHNGDFEQEVEDEVAAYDVFFEVFCPDIKIFTDVRVGADSASNDFEAIVNALDNEGLTDEDSIKKALIAGKGDTGQGDYDSVTVWNDDNSMGYCVDRVVPLKAVDIEVEYNGIAHAKQVLVPINANENTLGRYFASN